MTNSYKPMPGLQVQLEEPYPRTTSQVFTQGFVSNLPPAGSDHTGVPLFFMGYDVTLTLRPIPATENAKAMV